MSLKYKFTVSQSVYELIFILMHEWELDSHKEVIRRVMLDAADDSNTVDKAIERVLIRQKVMRGE